LKLIEHNSLEYSKKYVNREPLERLYAQREECDDILIVQNGYIKDTTIANVAFFDGRDWLTPSEPLLNGTTRERLLQEGFLKTEDIRVDALKRFQKMALMNAMIDFDIIADKKIEELIC
jgi:4-amino-4-deoxychorismate lyase